MYRLYATPLRIEFRPSAHAAVWLIATHLPALAILLFGDMGAIYILLCCGMLIVSFIHAWRRYVLHSHQCSLAGLTWQSGDRLLLEYAQGEPVSATLMHQAFLMPWLVIVRCRSDQGTQYLPIFPDMVDRDSFRRLRVRLRTELSTPMQ